MGNLEQQDQANKMSATGNAAKSFLGWFLVFSNSIFLMNGTDIL